MSTYLKHIIYVCIFNTFNTHIKMKNRTYTKFKPKFLQQLKHESQVKNKVNNSNFLYYVIY